MALKIETIVKIDAGTTAKDEAVNFRHFLIQNNSADKIVYFKEKDGVACTANNGFSVQAGKTLDKLMTADTLSIYATGSADVRILYVNEE